MCHKIGQKSVFLLFFPVTENQGKIKEVKGVKGVREVRRSRNNVLSEGTPTSLMRQT